MRNKRKNQLINNKLKISNKLQLNLLLMKLLMSHNHFITIGNSLQ